MTKRVERLVEWAIENHPTLAARLPEAVQALVQQALTDTQVLRVAINIGLALATYGIVSVIQLEVRDAAELDSKRWLLWDWLAACSVM